MQFTKQPSLAILPGANKKRTIVSFIFDWTAAAQLNQNVGGFSFAGNILTLDLQQLATIALPAFRTLTLTQTYNLSNTGGAGDLAFWGGLIVSIPLTGMTYQFVPPTFTTISGSGFIAPKAVLSACVPIVAGQPSVIQFGKIQDDDVTKFTTGILSVTLSDFELPAFVTSGVA